jgi:hypothetical protein
MLLCARFTKKLSPSMTSMGWQQQQQWKAAAVVHHAS